jgi:hypothetical protein
MLPRWRRVVVIGGLAGGGLLALVMTAAVVCWFKLPYWAPLWVVEHSPFVESVVRAEAAEDPMRATTPGTRSGFVSFGPSALAGAVERRMKEFGLAAVPALRRCLDGGDRDVRLKAFVHLHRCQPLALAELQRLVTDADPWMRLQAWDALCTLSYDHRDDRPRADEESAAALRCTLGLLDDPDGGIREGARSYLGSQASATPPWSVCPAVCARLALPAGRGVVATLLGRLCTNWMERHPGQPLPAELTFPLLGLGNVPDPAGEFAHLPAYYLAFVGQDPAQALVELTAMQNGERPWRFGAEPWMADLLRALDGRRVSFALAGEPPLLALTRGFVDCQVVADPWFAARALPPVTLALRDARLGDALRDFAAAIGARVQLGAGVVLLAGPQRAAISGFTPMPRIGEVAADRGQAAIAAWRTGLQRPVDLAVDDAPLTRILADLARRSRIPIAAGSLPLSANGEDDDLPLSLHLRQVPLERLLRIIAWQAMLEVDLGAAGIRFHRPEAR